MNFLNPLFLAGLFAASIPVLIYLWFRRKKRITPFPSLFLFKRIEQSSIRAVKITERLLLLLRILAIIFLVLGFTQPLITPTESEQPADGILVDESPWMMIRGTTDESESIRSRIKPWISARLNRFPELKVFSTDSLGGYRFQTAGSSRPVSWFHSVPELPPGGRWMVISKKGSPVLKKLEEKLAADSLKSVTVLALEDEVLPRNTGIQSVSFDPLIWQVNAPNPVTVMLGHSGKEPGPADLDLFVDDQFIQTYRIDTQPPVTRIQVPVQVSSRGWHSLTLKLRVSDFAPDNEWNGGFYLPERIPVLLTGSSGLAGFSAGQFLSAAAGTGVPLVLSGSVVQAETGSVWMKSSSAGTLDQYPDGAGGLIWFPDFQNPESVSRDLAAAGIPVSRQIPSETWLGSTANDPFWSFLSEKGPGVHPEAVSFGLIEGAIPPGTVVLARNEQNKPLILASSFRSRPAILFLTQPFRAGSIPAPWALASVLQSVLLLGSQSSGESGFHAWTFQPGSRPGYPGTGGRVGVRLAERNWTLELTGSLPLTLPPESVPFPGLMTFTREEKTQAIIGINVPFYRAAGNLSSRFDVIDWQESTGLPDGRSFWTDSLSFFFFGLALLFFLLETWISKGRKPA